MKACRHFKGDRPCKYYWIDRSWDCFECEHHNPYNERILLIKLDALGDVVRATALAEGIKKKYPNCQLSWITVKDAMFFVESNPFVDRVLEYNTEIVRQLQFEKFDTIINLDKDPKATSMMMSFNSEDKRGYGLSSEGHATPLNDGAKYHYNICLDNWGGKTKNTKSYQELIFEMAELDYDMEKPFFELDSVKFKNFESKFLYDDDNEQPLYVKDLVKGCLLVLEKGESMKPYNVGSGTGVTIGELVQAVVKSSDKNPTIEWDNSKPTTIPYKVSSIERLQSELNFKPDYTFEQGIKETMEWYENL